MLPCALDFLPTRAAHAVRATTLVVAPTSEAPLQVFHRPALLLQKRGETALHRRGEPAQRYGPGMATLYPAHADYDGDRWSASAGTRFSAVEFSPEACRRWLQRDDVLLPEGGRPMQLADGKLALWVDELERHCAADEPYGELYTEGLALALVAYLDGLVRQQADGTPRTRPAPARRVRELQAYIDAHLDGPLRVAELAALCGWSAAHFARNFRAAFGQPVHRYVLERRVQRARELLRREAMPIAQVALACGFASQAHFSAVFRREVGVTPSAFREA